MSSHEGARALRVAEFCTQYKVSRSVTYELIASGALRARKVGRTTIILIEDAEAWAASLPDVGSHHAAP